MANQRGTFAKRNREMKLKDRAREKAERRNARRAETREAKGPQIAWDEAGGVAPTTTDDAAPATAADPPLPSADSDTDS